jgi:SAM-dependent methyltransferase
MRWAERRWGFYARHYDRFVSFQAARRRSLALAAIQPGERVLIAGCGTGLDFEFLPPEALVEAVDYSPEMLAELRRPRAAETDPPGP